MWLVDHQLKRDSRALAQLAHEVEPQVMVMESAGIDWKCRLAALDLAAQMGAEATALMREHLRLRFGKSWFSPNHIL